MAVLEKCWRLALAAVAVRDQQVVTLRRESEEREDPVLPTPSPVQALLEPLGALGVMTLERPVLLVVLTLVLAAAVEVTTIAVVLAVPALSFFSSDRTTHGSLCANRQ